MTPGAPIPLHYVEAGRVPRECRSCFGGDKGVADMEQRGRYRIRSASVERGGLASWLVGEADHRDTGQVASSNIGYRVTDEDSFGWPGCECGERDIDEVRVGLHERGVRVTSDDVAELVPEAMGEAVQGDGVGSVVTDDGHGPAGRSCGCDQHIRARRWPRRPDRGYLQRRQHPVGGDGIVRCARMHLLESSPRAAMIYQHATRERDKAIADALGKLADTAKTGNSEGSGPQLARARSALSDSEPK
jgi:hypothetical protein